MCVENENENDLNIYLEKIISRRNLLDGEKS